MDLSGNDIGGHWTRGEYVSTPEGPKAIADALLVNGELTKCELRGNKLGVEGWTNIFNALRDSPTSKIAEWNLSREGLDPAIAKPLAEYLSVTGGLTSLE